MLATEASESLGEVGPPAQREVRLVDERMHRIIGVAVSRGPASRIEQRPCEHALADQPGERAALAKRVERDRAEVAREDGAVVRRGIVARGLALGPELDAGEPERSRVAQQAARGAGRR